MPVIIMFNEDGKTKLLANVEIKGSEEEAWDPRRVEVSFQKFEDLDIKAFLSTDKGLNPLALEENTLFIFPEKPSAPKQLPPWTPWISKERVKPSHVAYITSIDEKCGIATYSKFLSDKVDKFFPVKLHRNIHEVEPSALVHLQHEFGLFPYLDELTGKGIEKSYKLVTLHTVMRDPEALLEYYHALDKYYDSFVVHNDLAKKFLVAYTRKPAYVIPHGSVLWSPVPKTEARKTLGLPLDKKIIFIFGFAAESKGLEEVAKAASKMRNALFIISGAVHGIVDWHSKEVLARLHMDKPNNLIILGKYLTEEEINLYASSCDCLLFNYKTPNFISSASGAMHRVLAASKPIVCSIDNRLIELEDGHHALKYQRGDLNQMIHCLNLVLDDEDLASRLGTNARRLAEETSWRRVAEKHIKVYEELVGDYFSPEYYDEHYFDTADKVYFTPNGKEEKWGYIQTSTVNWLGWEDVVQGLKALFNPEKLLDVGTGTGGLIHYAVLAGIDAKGCDFSPYAVNHPFGLAKERIDLADVRELPYEDKSYELVIACDLMEHLYLEDLPKAISELQRVSSKWIFYNIGTTMQNDVGELVLKRGKLPPKDRLVTAVAGHCTVKSWKWWKEKLTNETWRPRDDLVEKFREIVPENVLSNWRCIIITQKIGVN